MRTEQLFDFILNQSYFIDHPPVLIDIGASGAIQPDWEHIAKYSECIAFDADSRDFSTDTAKSGFKKLHLVNAIVSDKYDNSIDFHLTKSPHCSSALIPINNELDNWSFYSLFEVENKISLPNKSLNDVLIEKNIKYVDWFKTDSQGIDLRLFKNLPQKIQENTIVAEFEPGFIDAYKGEDKIAGLLNYIEGLPFWMSDCQVKGSQRINKSTIQKYQLNIDALNLRNSSCWAEFTYINTCKNLETRELLLAIIFSIIKKQYGFALDICVMLESKVDKAIHGFLVDFLLLELHKTHQKPSVISRIVNKLKQ